MIVNTNLWYHSTYVLEGLAISLGDEFAAPNAIPIEKAYKIGRKISTRPIINSIETLF